MNRAYVRRLDAQTAAVHSHRVDDTSPETAATTERTFPRVSLSTVVPGSLVEIASGDIGIAIRFDGGNLRPIAWITTGHVGTMPASATVSLRATPTELDALTSADGASRPTLTLDREALGRLVREVWIAWAREQPSPKASWLVPWEGLSEPDREVDRRIGERIAREAFASRRGLTEEQAREMAREAILGANGGCAIVDRVAAALLRAARGETGPTKPGAQ